MSSSSSRNSDISLSENSMTSASCFLFVLDTARVCVEDGGIKSRFFRPGWVLGGGIKVRFFKQGWVLGGVSRSGSVLVDIMLMVDSIQISLRGALQLKKFTHLCWLLNLTLSHMCRCLPFKRFIQVIISKGSNKVFSIICLAARRGRCIWTDRGPLRYIGKNWGWQLSGTSKWVLLGTWFLGWNMCPPALNAAT